MSNYPLDVPGRPGYRVSMLFPTDHGFSRFFFSFFRSACGLGGEPS